MSETDSPERKLFDDFREFLSEAKHCHWYAGNAIGMLEGPWLDESYKLARAPNLTTENMAAAVAAMRAAVNALDLLTEETQGKRSQTLRGDVMAAQLIPQQGPGSSPGPATNEQPRKKA